MAWESGSELPLVMVITVVGRDIFTTDIDNSVAGFQNSRVTSSDKRRVCVVWEEAEHIHSQSFIGVEVATGL